MSCGQEYPAAGEQIDKALWRKVVSELLDAAARGELDPLMQKTRNCMDNHAHTNKGVPT